ncbi:hypothetical protein PHMEG_0007949 [Phytophthora megakarya]|uniref:Uncharacterized protein n=1 Tax=Phytophthora megakarya TaxID=4795 RepID=A0A225WMC5_9STRA|nr:hypothetical protein PHMEG_0007949 [Phytophthora megakarya]
MTGTAIRTFLKAKGADVSASVISRMKQKNGDKLHSDLTESNQNLEAYFRLMSVKNSGMTRSDCDGAYKTFRAVLIINNPSAAEWLDVIEQSHWVKYAFNEKFGLATFNEITSNLSEQANTWMSNDFRSSKRLDGFHLYFVKLSKPMSARDGQRAAGSRPTIILNWYRNARTGQLPLEYVDLPHLWRAPTVFYILDRSSGQGMHLLYLGDDHFPRGHVISAVIQEGTRIDQLYDISNSCRDRQQRRFSNISAFSQPTKKYPLNDLEKYTLNLKAQTQRI